MAAVSTLIESKEVVGQYPFSLDGDTQDLLIWMPKKLLEREARAQAKLQDVRLELRAISLGHETRVDDGIALEEGIPLDIR